MVWRAPEVGKVVLTGPAPAGGIVVPLKSNSALVTVPASVTVAAGQSAKTFPINTSATASTVNVKLTAKAGITTKTLTLKVQP